MSILDEIVEFKREEVAKSRAARPISGVLRDLSACGPPRDFRSVLLDPSRQAPRLIAEIKRRSPSKGALRLDVEPAEVAALYERHGAAAVSVLTDRRFFGGSLDDLSAVRQAVSLPVLRKEFVIDPYQIYEARMAGADAVLLIVAILPQWQLYEFISLCDRLGMAALVEVHDARQLEAALECGAEIIGINNRDLRTFTVDLGVTASLASLVPRGVVLVSESGIGDAAARDYLGSIGVDAILVGESLITASDTAAAVRELSGLASAALEGVTGGVPAY